MTRRAWRALVVSGLVLSSARSGAAQTNLQLWGNITLDWVTSNRLAYELDVEPKVLLSKPDGDPDWRNLDVTPNVEWSPKPWIDLVLDTTVGRTTQTDDVDTVEVTPRVGARFHLFSRAQRYHPRERAPARRYVVRDLVRFEARNFYYSGGDVDYSYGSRFRNRLEFLVPLNKERLTDDGARYLLTDWEWFIPLSDQDERFANKQRIRAGLGYRRTFAWRFEALYIWTRSRNTIEDDFDTSDSIINIRVKRFF
jgi:Protein of unknown function (DUF2490)